ncbi:hypothetical protein ACQY0O_006030 [Thecaphora frezii]
MAVGQMVREMLRNSRKQRAHPNHRESGRVDKVAKVLAVVRYAVAEAFAMCDSGAGAPAIAERLHHATRELHPLRLVDVDYAMEG